MGFAIVSQQKIHGAKAFNGVSAEASRKISGDNVNERLSFKNITIQPLKYKDYEDFVSTKKEEIRLKNIEIRKFNKDNPLKKQPLRRFPKKQKHKGKDRDAALNCQYVFTYSKSDLSERKGIEFLKLADKFLRERFSDQEILYSEIHLDEATPHLHFDMSYFNTIEKRFNQKELSQSGLTDINILRKDWEKYYTKHGFNLKPQDGSVVGKKHDGAKARHKVRELKQEVKRLKSIAYQEGYNRKEKRRVYTSYKDLYKQEKEKPEKIKEVEVEVVKIIKEDTEETKALVASLQTKVKKLERENTELRSIKQKLIDLIQTVFTDSKTWIKNLVIEDKTINTVLNETDEQQQQTTPTITTVLN